MDLLDFFPGDQLYCLTSSSQATVLSLPRAKGTVEADPHPLELDAPKPKRPARRSAVHSGPSSSSSSLSSDEEEFLYQPAMPHFLIEEIRAVEELQRQVAELERERKRLLLEGMVPVETEKNSKKKAKALPEAQGRKKTKLKTGAGFKVFFGGISFDDINAKRQKKIEDEEGARTYRSLEEGEWTDDKVDRVIQQRADNLKVWIIFHSHSFTSFSSPLQLHQIGFLFSLLF